MQKKETKALHPAVTAFMIILSLVALGFTAFAIGITFFILIEKYVIDPLNPVTYWDYDSLKFSIASLIITTPIYIVLINYIQKFLSNGRLSFSSHVRKWLSYLTILVSILVIIGELIAVIMNFLDGDLTLATGLKLLTVIIISTGILLYSIFDIRRSSIKTKNTLRIIFNCIIIPLTILSLALAIFMMESPIHARYRRIDEKTLNKLSDIKYAISNYNVEYKELPNNLETLKKADRVYLDTEDFNSIDASHPIKYTMVDNDSYSLCADFHLNTDEIEDYSYYNYNKEEFEHEAGYQCFDFDVYNKTNDEFIEPLMR